MDAGYGSFSGKANLYARYRPHYSNTYQNYLQEKLGFSTNSYVADVGAGTGIHALALKEIGCKIAVVEPDKDMLSECRCTLGNSIEAIEAKAEDTGLVSGHFDYVTVAQAFHLFDRDKSIAEFKRILKPQGKLVLVWNSVEHDCLFYAREEVIEKNCPPYKRDIHARQLKPKTYQDFFNLDTYRHMSFSNDATEWLDARTFIGRALSASYAPPEGTAAFDALIKGLARVFIDFQVGGKVEVRQSTVVYSGVIK